MKPLEIQIDTKVKNKFETYEEPALSGLLRLRKLIIEVAENTDGITHLEETLKWGEPSYLVRKGSTVRIDWKSKHSDRISMFFKCTSRLIPVFKDVFKDRFEFEGNRAIHFQLGSTLPEKELKQCIRTALTYHKVKQLDLLGLKSP